MLVFVELALAKPVAHTLKLSFDTALGFCIASLRDSGVAVLESRSDGMVRSATSCSCLLRWPIPKYNMCQAHV
jgi:hypothetical protein